MASSSLGPPLISTPPPPKEASTFTLRLLSHPSFLLLERCSTRKDLLAALPPIIKAGLYSEHVFQTKLVGQFAKSGSLPEACRVFESVSDKPDELYHTILKGHIMNSSRGDALSFFCRMKREGARHAVYNFTYLLKLCADPPDLKMGRQLHAQLLTHGFALNLFASTAVMNMYAKCRLPHEARKVFDRMLVRDDVTFNAMISSYSQNSMAAEALGMVTRMVECGERPDPITIVAALPACADLGMLRLGKSVHGYCFRTGFEQLANVSTTMLDMYSKCGSIRYARSIFDRMPTKNVVSWNSMIDGYTANGDAKEAMRLFRRMLGEGVKVTEVTVMVALNAASDLRDLEEGMHIHDLLIKEGLESNINVMNALISMYSKCRRLDLAAETFKNLPRKSLVSWNAMISGYAQNGHPGDALNCFSEMHRENVRPDSFTFASFIPAIADVSVAKLARWIHGYAVRLCLDRNAFVFTALVDMYAKSGGVEIARRLFDSAKTKHITTWNAMIDGYGTHGMGRAAVELFEEMKRSHVQPNEVSFLCVLSACSHSGLVEEGKMYFKSMKQDYGLEPGLDHCSCMVDILGRAGFLEEAWDFVQQMPIKPGISIFGAMLGACKIHKNVKLAEKAAERLFELEPAEGGYHVLLSNIYATASMWDDVARVRTMMEKSGLQKTPGCTFLELKNEIHTFYSGSTIHPQAARIYEKLEELFDEIKAVGYVPDTNSIHDVEDDVKEQLLNTHSEKLAIAFALINTSAGTTIQIRKNLRVCGDCHNATKYISLVTGREIVVRDMHRFHHFKNGVCSCGDYW